MNYGEAPDVARTLLSAILPAGKSARPTGAAACGPRDDRSLPDTPLPPPDPDASPNSQFPIHNSPFSIPTPVVRGRFRL